VTKLDMMCESTFSSFWIQKYNNFGIHTAHIPVAYRLYKIW